MLTAEERKALLATLIEKREDIKKFQAEFNILGEKKEHWFGIKTKLSEQISQLIESIKKSRSERNTLTDEVKKTKEERNLRNKDVKESVARIKELEKERDTLLKKHKVKDPTQILNQIALIETKIETEPMSYDKEKKLMQKIKEMKKEVQEASLVSDVVKKIRDLSKEIDERKQIAQQSHNRLQQDARKSQEKHEAILEASKEIDELRKKEEEAFANFIENKQKFDELNDTFRKKIAEARSLSGQAEVDKSDRHLASEERRNKALEQKKISVEEKIKKKMKLTTEDILAFQGEQKEEKEKKG